MSERASDRMTKLLAEDPPQEVVKPAEPTKRKQRGCCGGMCGPRQGLRENISQANSFDNGVLDFEHGPDVIQDVSRGPQALDEITSSGSETGSPEHSPAGAKITESPARHAVPKLDLPAPTVVPASGLPTGGRVSPTAAREAEKWLDARKKTPPISPATASMSPSPAKDSPRILSPRTAEQFLEARSAKSAEAMQAAKASILARGTSPGKSSMQALEKAKEKLNQTMAVREAMEASRAKRHGSSPLPTKGSVSPRQAEAWLETLRATSVGASKVAARATPIKETTTALVPPT